MNSKFEVKKGSSCDDSLVLDFNSLLLSDDSSQLFNKFSNDDEFISIPEKEIKDRAIKNLLSILISIVRKEFNNDTSMKAFLDHIFPFIFSAKLSLKLQFYNNEINKYFAQIRMKNSAFDSFLFYHYRQNLYSSLIGSDCKKIDQIRIDTTIKQLHNKYLDYLIYQQQINEKRNKNKKKLLTICDLYKHCFNGTFQSNVKLLLTEQLTKMEYLQKKLENVKETNNLLKESENDNAEYLQQQYKFLVIENYNLEEQIERLERQKCLLQKLDPQKVEQLRRCIKNYIFVQALKQSPNDYANINDNSTLDNSQSFQSLSFSFEQLKFE